MAEQKEIMGTLVKEICVTTGYGRITKVVSAHYRKNGVDLIDIARKYSTGTSKETGETYEYGKAGLIDYRDAVAHCQAVLAYISEVDVDKLKGPRDTEGEVKVTKADKEAQSKIQALEKQLAEMRAMIEGKKKPSSTPKNSESVAELGEVAVSNMMTNTKKLNSIAKTLKPRK